MKQITFVYFCGSLALRRYCTIAAGLFRPLLCAALLLAANVAWACPNCKETLAGDPTADGLARGFYFSIIFMLSMPFFILGSLSAYFYYLVRRHEREKELAQSLALNPGSSN